MPPKMPRILAIDSLSQYEKDIILKIDEALPTMSTGSELHYLLEKEKILYEGPGFQFGDCLLITLHPFAWGAATVLRNFQRYSLEIFPQIVYLEQITARIPKGIIVLHLPGISKSAIKTVVTGCNSDPTHCVLLSDIPIQTRSRLYDHIVRFVEKSGCALFGVISLKDLPLIYVESTDRLFVQGDYDHGRFAGDIPKAVVNYLTRVREVLMLPSAEDEIMKFVNEEGRIKKCMNF